MTLILGIDPSAKKIAVVGIQPETMTYRVEATNLYPKGETSQSPASLHNAAIFMRDFLGEAQVMASDGQRFAYVEQPLVGRGGASATIKQAYVGGVIRACLVEAGFKVYDAHPSTWRAALGIKIGKGTSTAQAKAAIKQRLDPKLAGLVGSDSDLADAGGIALYGVEQTRKAALLVPAGPDGGGVQGRRPDVVVRPARVRRVVRR